MPCKGKALTFIGGGHITGILLERLLSTGAVAVGQVLVSEPDERRRKNLEQRFSIRTTKDNKTAAVTGDIIFICVRPQVVKNVLAELTQIAWNKQKTLVSLAAGMPMDRYKTLDHALAVVRVLPNPPSQIGQGIVAVCFNEYVSAERKEELLTFFSPFGKIMVLSEEKINTVTALTCPATVLLFFKSLCEAGIRAGLDREQAADITAQTISGTISVWRRFRAPVADLFRESCTPGGISEEIVSALEEHGFSSLIAEAIEKAVYKAEILTG